MARKQKEGKWDKEKKKWVGGPPPKGESLPPVNPRKSRPRNDLQADLTRERKAKKLQKEHEQGSQGRAHDEHFARGAAGSVPVGVRQFKNKGYDNPNKEGSAYSGASGSMHRMDFQDEYNNQKAQDPRASHSTLTRRTSDRLNARRARQAGAAEDYRLEAIQTQPVIRPGMADIGDIRKAEQASGWKTEPDLFTNPDASKRANKQFTSLKRFMDSLPQEMRAKLDADAKTPGTVLTAGLDLTKPTHGRTYSPAVGRRLEIVSRSLQQGSTLQEAYEKAAQDNRGRSLSGSTKPATGKEARYNRPEGRKTKFVTTTGMQGSGFQFGVDGSTIDKMTQLREKLPESTDKELIRMQQYQRMDVASEIMKNQRWAHETQRARVLGKAGKEEGKNKVVFFTTSVGHPSASVPADSLIGQYVIRQRKKFLTQERVFKGNQLRGEFPDAVRDMHVVELGTGVSLGAQGVVGAFQKSGWRAGKRKSAGYGRPVPVGSQIMYDSQGRPIYDRNGNIRFTDGATRQFDVGTDKDLGLRIFVG